MTKYLIVIVVFLAVFGVGCNSSNDGNDGEMTYQPINPGLIQVSLISLLIQPEVTMERLTAESEMRTFGYLSYFGTPRLFLTKDHANGWDINSSIRVIDDTANASLSQSACMDKYVHVRGKLRRDLNLYDITKVSRITDANTGDPCWILDESN